MISLENLLNIICTEAFEYGGIPEVPDHKHGAISNFSTPKRDARGEFEHVSNPHSEQDSYLQYDLELVLESDGTLRWYE